MAGWKKRLEDLDSLPGEEAAGRSAAWEKLHDRLHEAPRLGKLAWYWVAACLFLIAAVPFLLRKKSTQTQLNDLVHQQQPSPVPVKTIDAPKLPLNMLKETVIQTTRSIEIKRSRKHNTKGAVNQREGVAMMVPQPDTATNQSGKDSAVKAIALVATAAVNKKLPVVHINELGKQEQENAKFASHNSWPSFQIKFLNQDNASGAPLPAVNTAQEMLKIKIPLKN